MSRVSSHLFSVKPVYKSSKQWPECTSLIIDHALTGVNTQWSPGRQAPISLISLLYDIIYRKCEITLLAQWDSAHGDLRRHANRRGGALMWDGGATVNNVWIQCLGLSAAGWFIQSHSLQGRRRAGPLTGRDPPWSDRGRTDHRQLEMNENTWREREKERERESCSCQRRRDKEPRWGHRLRGEEMMMLQ